MANNLSLLISTLLIGFINHVAAQADVIALGTYVDFYAMMGLSTRRNLMRGKPTSTTQAVASQEERKLSSVTVGLACAAGSDYDTISEALTGSPATTLNLCAETFEESLVISRSVTIVGQGKGNTVILLPQDTEIGVLVDPGVSVKLQALTIDGFDDMSSTVQAVLGVRCDSSDLELDRVEITNIRSFNPAIPDAEVFFSSQNSGDNHVLTVSNTDLSNVGVLGMFISGPGVSSASTVEHTTFQASPTSNLVVGLQSISGASVTVKDNSFSGFTTDPMSPSRAINFVCPGSGTSAEGNTISNADLGIVLDAAQSVNVKENVMSNIGIGVEIIFEPGLPCPSPTATRQNIVNANDINSSLFGIRVASPLPATDDITSNTIKNQDIKNAGEVGLIVFTGENNNYLSNKMDQAKNGIAVIGGMNNLYEENTIKNSGEYGIRVFGGTGNTLEENTITNSGIAGILVEAPGNFFDDNEVDDGSSSEESS